MSTKKKQAEPAQDLKKAVQAYYAPVEDPVAFWAGALAASTKEEPKTAAWQGWQAHSGDNLRRCYELEYKLAMIARSRSLSPRALHIQERMQAELDNCVHTEALVLREALDDWFSAHVDAVVTKLGVSADQAYSELAASPEGRQVLRAIKALERPSIVALQEAVQIVHTNGAMASNVYEDGMKLLRELSTGPRPEWDADLAKLLSPTGAR